MEVILKCSCGLDVHKDKIDACILKDVEGSPYSEQFGCISKELDRLCQWLTSHEGPYFASDDWRKRHCPACRRIVRYFLKDVSRLRLG